MVLSIAGFDPSGGAGVLADIKTLEEHKVYGLSLISANTIQTDDSFVSLNWISTDEILKGLKVLIAKYDIGIVKIGLIEDVKTLNDIADLLLAYNLNIKLIWDPVLSSSSGFQFHNDLDIQPLLKKLFLLTPNYSEILKLGFKGEPKEIASQISSKGCNVLLKGGHNETEKGKDFLYTTENKVFPYNPSEIIEIDKHGTGCVLSSAIAANLANGDDLRRSCLKAKSYISRFFKSNYLPLGYHKR